MKRGHVTALAAAMLLTPSNATAGADPIRDAQWHLRFLHVAEAHRISTGTGIVVAVVDTGVEHNHPDLAANTLPGVDLTPGASLVGDDPRGWTDTTGHGTEMAGLVAAKGRALGIAPDARILPVRTDVSRIGAPAGPSPIPEGIDWAIAHHADVITLAVASPEPRRELQDAIERALKADIVVVAGAGNRPESTHVGFPAAYPGVVAAAGVDRKGDHAAVSVTGPEIVLAAPAVDIASTGIDFNGYGVSTGTSDATAIISGAAALVRPKYPNLPAAEVVHRLTATADDRGRPGRDDEYGYGVLNIVQALTADVPPLTPTPQPSPPTPTATARNRSTTPTAIVVALVTTTAAVLTGTVLILTRRRRRP